MQPKTPRLRSSAQTGFGRGRLIPSLCWGLLLAFSTAGLKASYAFDVQPDEIPAIAGNTTGEDVMWYVDTMRMGQYWQKMSDWSIYGLDDLDAQGYVTTGDSNIQATLHSFQNRNLPAGNYTLTWSGNGVVMMTLGTLVQDDYPTQNRRVYYIADPENHDWHHVRIVSNSAAPNHVRDIHYWIPGYGPGSANPNVKFYPPALEPLQDLQMIRHMDLNATNLHGDVSWSDRKQPDWVFQTNSLGYDQGIGPNNRMCWEDQIAIANETDSHLHITIPHKADDNYVRQLAKMIANESPYTGNGLDPSKFVMVEYTNEVWNSQFAQTQWIANTLAPQLGASSAAEAYGIRAAQIWDIFEEEFDAASNPPGLARYLGGWSGGSGLFDEVALEAARDYGTTEEIYGGGASYPYLNPYDRYLTESPNRNLSWDVDAFFDAYEQVILGGHYDIWKADQAVWDADGNAYRVGYEGGQHIFPDGSEGRATLYQDYILGTSFQQHERMAQAMAVLAETWLHSGALTHNMYVAHGRGSWPHWDTSTGSTPSPKYAAVMEVNDKQVALKAALATEARVAVTTVNEDFPQAVLGTPFNYTLAASGSGLTWSIIGGRLPAGLTMNSSGVISGTPSLPEQSSFMVQAMQSNGNYGVQILGISVLPVSDVANTISPYLQDFDSITLGQQPANWSAVNGSATVQVSSAGSSPTSTNMLSIGSPSGDLHYVYTNSSEAAHYTIEAVIIPLVSPDYGAQKIGLLSHYQSVTDCLRIHIVNSSNTHWFVIERPDGSAGIANLKLDTPADGFPWDAGEAWTIRVTTMPGEVEGKTTVVIELTDQNGVGRLDSVHQHGSLVQGIWILNDFTSLTHGAFGLRSTGVSAYIDEFNAGSYRGALEGTQIPYTAHSIPGRIQAEDYDGGLGLGYADYSAGNAYGQYRGDDVDIDTTDDSTGNYHIGSIEAAEWLEYTIPVVPHEDYDISVRVRPTNSTPKAINFLLDGRAIGKLDLPVSGGWQDVSFPYEIELPDSANGILRLEIAGGGFDLNWIDVSVADTGQESYFSGVPKVISTTAATRIEAEEYDVGGSNIAYRETRFHTVNLQPYDSHYRSTELLNDRAHSEGWSLWAMADRTWVEYTVDLTAGIYNLTARYKCARDDGDTEFFLNGRSVGHTSGNRDETTGGAWNVVTVASQVSLPSDSSAVFRMLEHGAPYEDVEYDWFEFVPHSSAPFITTELDGVVTGSSAALSLTGTHTGSSNLTYQWEVLAMPLGANPVFSNGASTNGSSGQASTNTITGDLPGSYLVQVTVTDGTYSVVSQPFVYDVTSAPQIVTHPQSQMVTEGANVTLSVTATGNQLSYQWQSTTLGGSSWSNISGALGSVLTLTTVDSSDEGDYRVVITDVALNTVTSNVASVEVDLVPTITTTSLPSAILGTAYTHTLQASGGNGTLTWSVVSGSLPAGLGLSGSGLISGTPSGSAGTSNFTARASDADSDYDDQALSLLVQQQAAAPTFSPSAGTYETSQNITLSSTTSGATFIYTTDGSDPKTSGTATTGSSLTLNESATVRAYAQASGFADSAVSQAVYVIDEEEPVDGNTLAVETFDYTASTLLEGLSGGSGWGGDWEAEGGSTSTGYVVASDSLEVGDLITDGNKLSGGHNWRSVGRLLDLTTTFAPYLNSSSRVGEDDTDLWFAWVQQVNNTGYTGKFALDHSASVFHDNNGVVRVQNVGGDWQLSLLNGAQTADTEIAVTTGATLFVLRIRYGTNDIADLYINPPLVAQGSLGSPDATLTTTSGDLGFTEIVWFPNHSSGHGALDEIRIGTTFESVTPRPSTEVWSSQDVGSPSLTGSMDYNSGTDTFTLEGSGDDIWNNSDSFHYATLDGGLTGNGTITARVVSMDNTHGWAKAGVMLRATLDDGSPHVMTAITPGNGAAFQRRVTADQGSDHTGTGSITAPYWVRLTRSGTSCTGYISSNGTSWTQIGSAVTISAFTGTVQVGICVTSHNNSALCTAVFDNLTVDME